MKLVSVIVPCYNGEKDIERCLNSIVNQTYKKIEVIVVDDGSKDNSKELIKEYVNNYPNVNYYYKKNGGLSSARNFGLKKATGDYIAFVDSDDYIDLKMLEKMYNSKV